MKYENAFYVIKYTEAPSVLLETLFVSNQSDAEKLLDEEWLAAEAQGIAAGIKLFFPTAESRVVCFHFYPFVKDGIFLAILAGVQQYRYAVIFFVKRY